MKKNIYVLVLLPILFFYAAKSAHGQKIVFHDAVMLTNGRTTLYNDSSVAIFGFSTTIFAPFKLPSRTLYANEGDSVVVIAHNHSRDPHTVHLHGTDVDTRNDGDPMTSFSIDHDEDTTYSFRANHAGTYIYHCHFQDVMHLQMGMYGLLIIKAANGAKTAWTGGPSYSKEYAWLTSELDKYWHDTYEVIDAGHENTLKHPKYRPKYFLINGKSQQQLIDTSIAIAANVGDKIYLRLANIGFYTNSFIFPSFMNATVIDSDGRPLPSAFAADTVEVMPGERYGVMLSATNETAGSIVVNYINMNTNRIEGIETVPFSILPALGVNDKKASNIINLFPNPVNDNLKINFYESRRIDNIYVTNSLGKIVQSIKISESLTAFELRTDHLSPGLYCLSIHSDTGVLQKTFIIQR